MSVMPIWCSASATGSSPRPGLLAVALILAAGIVWLATRSRYIPYVVEVDKLGYALTIPQPLTATVIPEVMARMERYEIAAFIRNARSVSSDPQVEQQQLNALLAHARGAADRFLDAYYHADGFTHNPFKLAEKQTVTVQIDSILQPLASTSYQVRWTETTRDLNGVDSRCADALGSAAPDRAHPASFQRHDRKQSARPLRDPDQLDATGPISAERRKSHEVDRDRFDDWRSGAERVQ